MTNIDELEKVLLSNWAKFINPQRFMAFVLAAVRDMDLRVVASPPPTHKDSVQITLSQFRPDQDRNFILWADFTIPKEEGIAIGTCEIRLDPYTGLLSHLQTLGNIYVSLIPIT